MGMEKEQDRQVNELLARKAYRDLRDLLRDMNEVDAAYVIEELEPEKAVLVYRTLPKGMAADVFTELSPDKQEQIIESVTDRELHLLVEDLFVDDMVDMLEELPAVVVNRVLKNATPQTRDLVNQYLQYKEDSAGGIMTAEFINLKKNLTVADAFLRIRRTAFDKETVYTCYVTDDERHLSGIVTVKTLLLSDDDELIESIMETDIIAVRTDDDREEVIRKFSKYGFLSIPVVDNEDRLVGIVTVDDAVDVINEEATEDFEKMAALLPSERPYLKTSILGLAKNRIVWLLVLMISAMITGLVLERYEAAFAALPLLVTFIPMLTDTGGNAGAQSSTLVIRALALSEIKIKDILRVIWIEFRVSLIVGAVLCVVNYIRLVLMYPGKEAIALTVAIALFATVIIAKTVGGVLPLVAKALKVDPAIMAAPLITTIVDAFSLVIYFTIAQRLLML